MTVTTLKLNKVEVSKQLMEDSWVTFLGIFLMKQNLTPIASVVFDCCVVTGMALTYRQQSLSLSSMKKERPRLHAEEGKKLAARKRE